jgi:hypothetical protein
MRKIPKELFVPSILLFVLKFLARLKEPHMILPELMYIYFKMEYP